MAGETRNGYEGQLYYGTAGSTAATQLTNVEDLDYNIDTEDGETTVRGLGTSVPIQTDRVTKLVATITWKMRNKPADTSLAAILAASRAGTPIALRTKSYSSGLGYDGDVIVKANHSMPLTGTQMYEFTGKPTDDAGRAPSLNV